MKNHSEFHFRNYYFKPDVITNVLIYSIAFILIFVTDRTSIYSSNFSNMVSNILLTRGFLHPAFLSVFEILIILLSFRIILTYGVSINYANYGSIIFFVLTLLMIFLTIVNPNNHSESPIFGLALFSDISNYTHIIFLYVLLFVRKCVFINLLRWFFKSMTIMIIINVVLLYSLYLGGFTKGILLFGGHKSILMAEDILLIFVFFQILFLHIYNKNKNKTYLFLSILLIGVQILSFRRSGFFLTILINTLYFTILHKSSKSKIKLFIYPSLIILFVIISFNFHDILSVLPQSVKVYVFRIIGAFVDMEGARYIGREVITNVHFEESSFAFQNALTNLKFWGKGYGTSEFDFLYKGSTGIHNAYIAVWNVFGLFALVYYLYIMVLVFVEFTKTLIRKRFRDHNLFQLKIIISIYLILFLLTGWILILQNFIGIKMIIFRSLLLVTLLKIDDDYIMLIEKLIHQNHVNNPIRQKRNLFVNTNT